MRICVIKDNTIDDIETWKADFSDFMEKYVMKPTFHVIERDFSFYPTVKDSDGDLRPEPEWLKRLVEPAIGFDHVFLFIPIERWRSGGDLYRQLTGDVHAKGIWGTNYSYTYGDFHIHYCRWDTKNPANTFGTSWHEMAHSFDSLIKVETGVDIRPLLKVANYDQEVVHGKSNVFDYIRWKENTEIFKKITPHLVDAYNVRAKRYFTKRAGLLAQIVALKRLILMRLNRKNGIPR